MMCVERDVFFRKAQAETVSVAFRFAFVCVLGNGE
jgi:hypothetical protein